MLGRVREAGGMVRQRFRASSAGRPLLAEDLVLDGARPRVGVVGGDRVVDSVTVLGRRGRGRHSSGVHRLELDGAGTVVRHLGAQTHTSPLEPVVDGHGRRRPRRPVPA